MGVSLIAYQLKQECKKEFIKQLKRISKEYNNNDVVEKALCEKEKLVDEFKISYLYYPGSCADDILMILNQDKYPDYDKSKIGYWAVYGKVENELSHPDSHISYLDTEDIKRITYEIEHNEITNKKGFIKYYKNLPQKVKNSLFGDWGDVNIEEEEYYWKDIKEIYDFYKDCEINKSWVYLNYG